jgi:hypothetical protein
MAILKRIDDLDENALNQFVLSEEREFPDGGVKIASTDLEVVDEEGEEARVNLTMECEHVRVG